MRRDNYKGCRNSRSNCNAIASFAHPTSPAGKRPRVLLVEDDEAVRRMLLGWLEAWGYPVVTAENGDIAWNILLQDGSPELLIMDWMMPGIDGVELCRKLRKLQSSFYRYILLITGKNNKEDIACALEAGADDYLAKPFDLLDLRSRLTVATRILSVQDDLIKARDRLRDQAMVDGLTGVWNRSAFLDLFRGELDRAARTRTMTGLLMLDLDHFKKVNDTHGHAAGDAVLKETATRLKGALRSYDFLGRYGGEEFFIALPNASRNQLCEIAERVRLSVVTEPVRYGNIEIKIGLSIGAVEVMPGQRTALEAIAVADVGLYHAKNSGRNRTVYCRRSWQELSQSKGSNLAFCQECQFEHTKQCTISVAEYSPKHSVEMGEPWIIFPSTVEVDSRGAIGA
ncbi:MAG: diguanylate cyclase [Terracidiphilus sp.]